MRQGCVAGTVAGLTVGVPSAVALWLLSLPNDPVGQCAAVVAALLYWTLGGILMGVDMARDSAFSDGPHLAMLVAAGAIGCCALLALTRGIGYIFAFGSFGVPFVEAQLVGYFHRMLYGAPWEFG
jgi:hypothetical protein